MRSLSILMLALGGAPAALAEDARAPDRIQRLEQRIEQLEQAAQDSTEAPSSEASASSSASGWERAANWAKRVHLSGNADVNYLNGGDNSKVPNGRFSLENARFFLDFDVDGESELWGHPLIGATSFYFEWDLARADQLKNTAGSLYLRLDRIFNQPALSAKIGRMPLPFGEEYVRFHDQRPENPLISFSAASVYGYDEGVLLFGALKKGLFQYMFAVTDGDAGFAENSAAEPAVTGKLVLEPASWLHVSVSAHRTGRLGPTGGNRFALSAIEVGGYELYPNRLPTFVIPTFQNGVVIPRDPSPRLDDVYAFEGDIILRRPHLGQLWLSYGRVFIESESGAMYDGDLHYWTSEGVLELGAFAEALDRFYVAVRYSAIGTFDADKGWRLRVMNDGANLGYNVDHIHAVNAGFGVRLGEHVVLKAEYSWFDFDLVRGVPPALQALAASRNYAGVGLSLEF